MYKLLVLFLLTIIFSNCNLLENKEKMAIEICQKAKVQFQAENGNDNIFLNALGLTTTATWLDFANVQAKKEPNKKYDWRAEKTAEGNFYLVAFIDEEGWGHRWEVDIEQQIVKSINGNEYLSRKYGLSRLSGNSDFEIIEPEQSELKLDKHYNNWEGTSNSEIVYIMKASVLNKTDKTLMAANIDGKLKLIFKDKTIEADGNYDSGFKNQISKSRPWLPNTTQSFVIKTKGIEKIYLGYIPEYVVFDIALKVEDPVGYSFDKDIQEIDLKNNWTDFKTITGSNEVTQKTKNKIESGVEKNNIIDENTTTSETDESEDLDSKSEKNGDNEKSRTGGGDAYGDGNGPSKGTGISFDLNSRMLLFKPTIEDGSQETGKVVVSIKVDKAGNVIEARPGARGSTTTSSYLFAKAKEAALKAQFNARPEADDPQQGTMTFVFLVQ